MAEPGALTELALDAIAKYFYDLCNRILPNPQSEEVRIDIETVAPVFEDLHSLLAETVPVDLANKLTNKLLVTLYEWLETVPWDRDMVFMLVRSVMHPLVTRIEPVQDSLHCSDIFNRKREFCNPFLGDFLAKTAQLSNLKALHLRNFYSENWELVSFTSQLEEFSGNGLCDNIFMKIAKTCKKLKYLDLYQSSITDNSIDVILNEMDQLEWLNVANTSITSNGITRLLHGLIEKGDLLKLKYLKISYSSECLELLQMLPSLTLSLQDNYDTHIMASGLPVDIRVSDLFVLHNLHGLTITTTLRVINDLLREIGSQLVYLDVTIKSIESEYLNQGGDFLDMLLIGQYCKKLKCLHISDDFPQTYPTVKYFPHLPLPGFQTVTCLNINLGEFNMERDKTSIENIVYTLASQCVNVKKVTVLVDPYCYTRLKLVQNFVQNDCLKITEEVNFNFTYNFCEDLFFEGMEIHIEGEKFKDEQIVGMLVKHCSKLHTVGGFSCIDRNHRFNTQRVKIKD